MSQEYITIRGARENNLKNVSLRIPKRRITIFTGVSGSGKSSIVFDTIASEARRQLNETFSTFVRNFLPRYAQPDADAIENLSMAIVVDQKHLGGGSHSTVGTITDIYSVLRLLYKRFKDEVLAYKFHDQSISDVLNMPVREALDFFDTKEVAKDVMRKLQALSDVGLDYLTLGQPLSTLSGGECQRIKLASELHKKGSMYVMDEPTTGLHMSDISHLLAIINRLVDAGNTVIVIEHNLAIIKNADWIIDMGPEGGNKGGRVMFEGTPQQLLDCEQSLTSAYLRTDIA